MMLKLTMLVLMAVVLFACGSAQAAGILGIPIEDVDVSYTVYNPIGDGDSVTLPTASLHPYPDVGPPSPSALGDLDDWAKSNLCIELPFEGDEHTVLRPRGIGLSEAVQITTIQTVPIRAGIAYITGAGTCVFVRAEAFQF